MNKLKSLGILILAFILLILSITFSKTFSLMLLLLFLSLISFLVYYKVVTSEKYNYNKENPNALRTGQIVAGTVYASYPQNAPGLGWV